MIKNRYYKTLLGVFAEILIGKNVVYTTEVTYDAFVANAPVGTVGVFNAATKATITAAVATGTDIFIAVKRGAKLINKSTPFNTGTLKPQKTPYVAPAKQVSTVSTAAGATVAEGDILELLVVETTPGHEPFPRFSYFVKVTAGQTLAQAIQALVDKINADNLDVRAYKNEDPTVDATLTATDDILLTAKDFGRHFTVALRGRLSEIATAAVTTKIVLGNGTPEMMTFMEAQGYINEGINTNYPAHGTPSEYGRPDTMVDQVPYDVFNFVGVQDSDTPLPQGQQHTKKNIILAVPKGIAAAYNPSNNIATIFGLTLN